MFACRTVPIEIHFFDGRNLNRTGEAETNPLGVGEIPNTLRQLRILLLPARVGAEPPGGAELRGITGPTAAANAAGIESFRANERVHRAVFDSLEIIGNKLIGAPLHHIAVHVVETPRIWFLGADLLILLVAVVTEPGIFRQL